MVEELPIGGDPTGGTQIGAVLRSCTGSAIEAAAIAICGPTRRYGVLDTTSALAGRVMEIETDLGEGPGWLAAHTAATIVMHTNDPHQRAVAPLFAASVAPLGVRCVIASPMHIGRCLVGVQVGVSTRSHIAAAEIARFESAASAAAQLVSDDSAAAVRAIDARVHQASGMLAVEEGVTPDVALVLLRASAFAQSRSVADVAADVLDRYAQPISTI